MEAGNVTLLDSMLFENFTFSVVTSESVITSPNVSSENATFPDNITTNGTFQQEEENYFQWPYDQGFEYVFQIITVVLTVIGTLSNAVTLFKIAIDKKLHKPTYAAIGCIAIPDGLSLLVGYCAAYMLNDLYAKIPYLYDVFTGLGFAAENSSAMHMIMLSGLRYSLTVHPLWSRIHITSAVVILISIVLWVFSFGLAAVYSFYVYEYYQGNIDEDTAVIIDILIWTYFLVLPCLAIIGFHIKKLRTIKKSMAPVSTTLTSRMSRIFLLILVIYIFTCVADLIFRCFYFREVLIGYDIDTMTKYYYIEPFIYLLWSLHYMANPVIYFLFAPPVKKFFQRLLSFSTRTLTTTSTSEQ